MSRLSCGCSLHVVPRAKGLTSRLQILIIITVVSGEHLSKDCLSLSHSMQGGVLY